MWFHDFNFTPLSSGIGVNRYGSLFILDEIILESAISRQSAIEFIEKFKCHRNKSVIIYGDASGQVGEKHGHASDYTEMQQILVKAGWSVDRRVKLSNPPIKDRQNAVRAKIRNANGDISLFVNPQKAIYCHKGLSNVQVKVGSSFIEEESEYQHITTAIGYCVEYEWPIRYESDIIITSNISTINHFNNSRR